MKKEIIVYIAGPYTIGDREANYRKHLDAAEQLRNMGYREFSPIVYSHNWDKVYPKTPDEWIDNDMRWIRIFADLAFKCDNYAVVVYRMPGESVGSDREEEEANMYGLPVFYSIEQLGDEYPPDDDVVFENLLPKN